MQRAAAWTLAAVLSLPVAARAAEATLTGELQQWHRVTLTFEGPAASETGGQAADPARTPFRDCRLDVAFTHVPSSKTYTVPGFFAADGNAAETGATAGRSWRVHFSPDATGEWSWRASFRQGPDVAVADDPQAGRPAAFDGATGRFEVQPSDKFGRDFRHHGRLEHGDGHYLRFAGSRGYFLKGGADSPENLLAYTDFDDTRKHGQQPAREGEAKSDALHRYEPHARDFRPGDPTWRGGKGRNIIGAMNYLASEGMNSVYFLTMNVGGDGKDVWPWVGPEDPSAFDCSKLDQWEIVFSHMTRLGLALHVITQETENDQLLDGGELGPARKLYYRELIARFSHHPALVWNLGEENSNTDAQRKSFAACFKAIDPYRHPVVVHTFPQEKERVYTPLLGFEHLDGPSLQIGDQKETHAETLKWVQRSREAGRPWFVCLDEIGPADTGVRPDAVDPDHDDVRRYSLWGNLMAGGAGVEWYFGYKFAHNDLNCEDWRSRDRLWDQTRFALEFFHRHLVFWEMGSADKLTPATDDYCFAAPGRLYAVYLPKGGAAKLDLLQSTGEFSVLWFNPRIGGELMAGPVREVRGPGVVELGAPPADANKDWVILVRRQAR